MKMQKSWIKNVQKFSPQALPRADFHNHTKWTDGKNSVEEMFSAAVAKGLKTILFSEHVRKTSGDWFFKYAKEVRALDQRKCLALVGAETKVEDFKGNVDINDETIKTCDLIMASVHRFPGEKGVVRGFADVDPQEASAIELDLLLCVLENPLIDIVGHPFGMTYRRFNQRPTPQQMSQVIRKAANTGVAFEINAHYHPNPWELIEECQSVGASIVFGSNAHETSDVGKCLDILEGKVEPWNPSAF